MGTDDEEDLSVSEVGTYSSSSRGPTQDTNVHAAAPEVHGERPAHLDRQIQNRAIRDPMARLRRSAQASAQQRPTPEPPSRWSQRLPLVIVGGALLMMLSCTGVGGIIAMSWFASSGPSEAASPTPQVTEPSPTPSPAPDGTTEAEAEAEAEEGAKEFDGVPVRKGLRGE